ncbi:28s ribosomal protein s18a mitochondrial [Echinococcus multilocularis]|uniref:28s ribosomal protein s18a mitochondrial n=1 Tax=Echinococcus multilocularis TaxID=6211 RepID=A0A068Y0U5_ECHMU|nr:28s ribosomal protein s18a mitochondrial [Echinococcus multilocularis]
MSSLLRFLLSPPKRCIFTSAHLLKKEIKRTEEGNITTYEGVRCKSERSAHLLDMTGLGDPRITDPIIRLGLKLRHTDVLILSQFLRPDGTILPREVSGLTKSSQLYVEMLIERAQNAGLLPISIDANGKHTYKDRGPHIKNVYYDSDIIGLPKFSKLIPRYKPPA